MLQATCQLNDFHKRQKVVKTFVYVTKKDENCKSTVFAAIEFPKLGHNQLLKIYKI